MWSVLSHLFTRAQRPDLTLLPAFCLLRANGQVTVVADNAHFFPHLVAARPASQCWTSPSARVANTCLSTGHRIASA
eukprot:986579-Rhodomonas_salina.2